MTEPARPVLEGLGTTPVNWPYFTPKAKQTKSPRPLSSFFPALCSYPFRDPVLGWAYFSDCGMDRAAGVSFMCPGEGCEHRVWCWEPGVLDEFLAIAGRWEIAGETVKDISLLSYPSSRVIVKSCGTVFYVSNGRVEVVDGQ